MMDRRVFLHRVGLVAVAATTLTVSFPAEADGRNIAAVHANAYKTLDRIEILVLSAGEKPYALVFDNPTPQQVPGADFPLAVSFDEHDSETVKMSLYSVSDDGSLNPIDYSFAGRNSTQHLDTHGVTFKVVAFAR